MPSLTLTNRQRAVRLDLPWLRRFAVAALPHCPALPSLEEIAIAIVSDRAIARLHRDFMQIDGPTDVITFQEGDIAISAETARARAGEFGHAVEEELALYIVHALLHLNGFDDTTPRAAARMHQVQDRLWSVIRSELPLPSAP